MILDSDLVFSTAVWLQRVWREQVFSVLLFRISYICLQPGAGYVNRRSFAKAGQNLENLASGPVAFCRSIDNRPVQFYIVMHLFPLSDNVGCLSGNGILDDAYRYYCCGSFHNDFISAVYAWAVGFSAEQNHAGAERDSGYDSWQPCQGKWPEGFSQWSAICGSAEE